MAYNLKSENIHNIGEKTGFFAAFLLFASMLYLILTLTQKIPQSVKYYHVLFFVILVYIAGFLISKLRKQTEFS